MASTFSRVKQNAREQVLSGDLNRAQQMGSRELQNLMAAMGGNDTGAQYSGGTEVYDVIGDGSGFTATIPAGGGLYWNPTFPGLTSDDSANLAMRWGATPLTFANPDGTNGRIDLIVADPVAVDTDLQSRNILLDPLTRNMTAQNVYKTINPASVLSVVTGTPAGSPVAPAVPANKCALYEVLVPALAPNASTFTFRQRLWRKALFPASTEYRILTGCKLQWGLGVDPATTTSPLSLATGPHRVLIDGELLKFSDPPAVFQDTGANPFGTSAPAGNSRPYYIYLCGGRNSPQGTIFSVLGTPFLVPAVIVESTTPPLADGRPSASISTPRGVTQNGAIYIGLGFVYKGTTNRQPCIMTPTTTHAKGSIEDFAPATSPQVFASMPSAKRTSVLLNVGVSVASGTAAAAHINPSAMGAPATSADAAVSLTLAGASAAMATTQQVSVPLDASSTGIAFTLVGTSPALVAYVRGYGHGVKGIA